MAETVEQQYRQIQEYNNTDDFSSKGIVGAAVALAASTALFYRPSNIRKIASGINIGYSLLKDVKKSSDIRLSGRTTYNDVKSFYHDIKNAWYQRRDEIKNTPIILDNKNTHNLFGYIEAIKSANNRRREVANKEFIQNYYIKPTNDLFNQIYNPSNSIEYNTKNRFEQYIKDMSFAMGNFEQMNRIRLKYKFHQEDIVKIQQIDDFLNKKYLDSTKPKNDALSKVNKQFDKIQDIAFDIDKLESEFGTSGNGFVEKLFSSTLNDRAATVKDILENENKLKESTTYEINKDREHFLSSMLDNIKQLQAKIRKEQGKEAEQRFLQLTPDRTGLRVDTNNQIYSINSIRDIRNDLLNFGANTLPGKILRLRSFEQRAKSPSFMYWNQGSFNPVLAALTNKDITNNKTLDASYFQIGHDIYRNTDDGLEKISLNANLHLISGIYGTEQKLLRQLTGQLRYKQNSNTILKNLDLFQDRDNYSGNLISRFKSVFTKFDNSEWRGNKFSKLFSPTKEEKNELILAFNNKDYNYAINYSNNYNYLNSFLKKNIYDLNRKTIGKITPYASKEASNYLNIILKSNDDELLDNLLKYRDKHKNQDILNKDLEQIINRAFHNKNREQSAIQLKTDREGTNLSTSLFDTFNIEPNNETVDITKRLKIEITKEAFLQEAYKNGQRNPINGQKELDYNSIFKLLDNITDNKDESIIANRLVSYTIFQNKTGINLNQGDRPSESLWKEISRVNSVLNSSNSEIDKKVRENLYNLVEERLSDYESIKNIELENIESPQELPEWIHIGNSAGPIELLKNLNNTTKLKATAKKSFTQFFAGTDKPENITTATMFPYFFLSRLSDDLNSVGLGFSKDTLGSTSSLLKGFAFKRILPVTIAGTYLEWADDTSQELTGTSISGSLANSIANVDLAFRGILDTLGLTEWLKEEKQINPIMQYWGDHNEFMNKDERKKWYETGYEPVRKGAWWTFGGVSEARGGEISYWQPSFVRRINSDYEDKSLYDGYFDKWSHSLLPTPTNPLSPIFNLLDPYWLEEKHENDRPYALSGPMFAEGTPWGAILNPTVSDFFKPEKELHPYRLNNGIDLYAILHQMNDYIKNIATNSTNSNIFTINGNSITPVTQTEYDLADNNSKIYSFNIRNDGNGKVIITNPQNSIINSRSTIPILNSNLSQNPIALSSSFINSNTVFTPLTNQNLDKEANSISIKNYLYNTLSEQNNIYQEGSIVQNEQGELGIISTSNNYINDEQYDINLEDSLALDRVINGDSNGIKSNLKNAIQNINPLNYIRRLNSSIKEQNLQSNKQNNIISPTLDNESIITPEKLRYFTPSQSMELLNDSYQVAELINAGKGSDFVKDAATSFRLISGIYGYMANLATGIGDNTKKRIAQSSDMTSFSRTFWDLNLGGAGGDVMEIIRRIIPDFKRNTRINPLINEMPDWLPERFQFGDPFTSIPKGEMRLPGEGYESLNKLHSDMYGRYGAFDRFKILADIAPFSPEFKLWKNIASKTITDKNLLTEMDEILTRVRQQGKKHDFYDYKVIGKNLDYQNIVVSEVLGYGKFKSGDTIYKLAGVKVQSNQNESAQEVLSKYIHPGDIVTIATDTDNFIGTNKDKDTTTNAAVFNENGENISQLMLQNGDATKKKGDTSAPATLVNYSPLQKIIAYGSELIAHADVPWLSDQFLRVRTPLESYRAEQVYGTPYQSWSHPINTFLLPAIERAIHESSKMPRFIYEYLKNIKGIPKKLADTTFLLGDRGAFIGAALSSLLYFNNGSKIMNTAKYSSEIINLMRFISGGNSYSSEVTSGIGLGYSIARFFEKDTKIGAIIGGLTGIIYRNILGNDNWIPNRVKRNWNTTEYFDQLTYLKYMGLYHAAAQKAKEEENVDVEAIQSQINTQEEKRREILNRMESIKEALNQSKASSERDRLLKLINSKISSLEPTPLIMTGGEWTHSALIYKQAAENTITALKPGANWTQILTALPTNDREYFIEFVKERNPQKRNEILNTVSPQLRKALLISWGKIKDISDEDIKENNEKFFDTHFLPSDAWIGWRPNIDLKDIQVKTIENEAMNLSDFGFYESQLRDPDVINAKPLNMRNNSANLSNNLKRVLEGQGLKDIDISVTTSASGTVNQIIANIKLFTGLSDLQRMTNEAFDQ